MTRAKPQEHIIKGCDEYGYYVDHVFMIKHDYYHREDGPAYIRQHDSGLRIEAWYYENEGHRYGGPSYSTNNGTKLYYIHGQTVNAHVKKWLEERGYVWETMSDIEKWELEMFMRTLG